MTQIISISLPDEQKTFLDENDFLKPSKIMQRAIEQIMEREKDFEPERRAFSERLAGLRMELEKRILYLEDKGLISDFEAYCKEKNV